VEQALSRLLSAPVVGELDREALEEVATRVTSGSAGFSLDVLRFAGVGAAQDALVSAFGGLTGSTFGMIRRSRTVRGSA
jgi:hypothetical protein